MSFISLSEVGIGTIVELTSMLEFSKRFIHSSLRLIHLFDTFQGLPLPGHQDPSFTEGQFACSLEQVKASLSQYQNSRFYKGLFPDSAEFFSDKPEPVIELSGSQCLIVRLGFPVSQ
jgi:hypothetical protein